jgi:large subunit ribosomal protein L24
MKRSATPPARRKLRIRSGDQVQVMAGKDRGKRGRVLRVEPTKDRLYVEGMNMVKRHIRPRAAEQNALTPGTEKQLAGVIEREGPIHVSNVMLVDGKGKPTRVRIERDGKQRSRIAKSSGTAID